MTNKFYSTIRKYYDYIFPLKQQQVNFVKSEFKDSNAKLIEIGCANGKLTNALCQHYDVVGIDLEQSFIDEAKNRYPEVEFVSLDMLKLDTLGKTFDGIICFGNTLVHIDTNSINTFISNCYHSLNANGKLLIQILNYDNILDSKIHSLPIIDNEKVRFVREYEFGEKFLFNTKLTAKEVNETICNSIELTPIRKNQLVDILKKCGFSKINVYGSFAKDSLDENSLPLVISCSRK